MAMAMIHNEKLIGRALPRWRRMQALRAKGWSLARIGLACGGVSRQRVHQALTKLQRYDAGSAGGGEK